jgi:hypothetical protein
MNSPASYHIGKEYSKPFLSGIGEALGECQLRKLEETKNGYVNGT